MRESHYRVRTVHPQIHKVRGSIKFSCGRGNLRSALTRFARIHGFTDERGTPRDSEVVRLLLVVALLKGSPDRIRTTVQYAVAVQKPLMVSSFGRSLTAEHATRASQKRVYGRDRSVERNWGFVVLGNWLQAQLQSISATYRDDYGRVRDGKLITDLATAALNDPDLPEIASGYARAVSRLRAGLARVHGEIRQLVAEAVAPASERRTA